MASASGVLHLIGSARARIMTYHYGSASGRLVLVGSAHALNPVTRVSNGAIGHLLLHGTAQGFVNRPYGSFRDFSHYPSGAVDPAMVLVRTHNGGATSSDIAQGSGYRRYFALAAAPLDYPVSGGKKAWARAAYASIGLKFKGLQNNGYEFIDGAQFEIAKYGAVAPRVYQPARALNCNVLPQLLNLATNPAATASDGLTPSNTGPMPNVVGFHNGPDSAAWQSTERVYVGTNSVAIDWYDPQYPSLTTFPGFAIYPTGVFL